MKNRWNFGDSWLISDLFGKSIEMTIYHRFFQKNWLSLFHSNLSKTTPAPTTPIKVLQ